MRMCFKMFLFVLTILYASVTIEGHVVGQAQYCWNGTDDFIARRNMTCKTGETSLGNVVSTRTQGSPTPGTQGSNTDGPHSAGHGYFCMMFDYYIITESVHENTETVKTKEILYTCDTDNLCEDRHLYEGYQVTYNGHEGILHCCNSNNCNNRDLSLGPEHKHTCIDAMRDTVSWKGQPEWCATEDMFCLRERISHVTGPGIGQEEMIEEFLSCDSANICAMQNLTKTSHSCKVILDESEKQEKEICCCKGDNCFIPDWFRFDVHQSGVPGPAKQPAPQSWQRTLLICIGVALAFLAVFVSICFVRRTRAVKREQEAELSRLEYKVIQSELDLEEEDGDSVKILPPDKTK